MRRYSQGAGYLALAYPPVSAQAVGVELPSSAEVRAAAATPVSRLPWGRGRRSVESQGAPPGEALNTGGALSEGFVRTRQGYESEQASVPVSREEGVFGCVVQITQHTSLPPQPGDEASGRCLVRCVSRGRCRLADVFEWPLQPPQGSEEVLAEMGGSPTLDEEDTSRETEPPCAIGVFLPFSDKIPQGDEAAAQSASRAPDLAEEVFDFLQRPLTRESSLREELRTLAEFVARIEGGSGRDWRRRAELRCCQICIEGLERSVKLGLARVLRLNRALVAPAALSVGVFRADSFTRLARLHSAFFLPSLVACPLWVDA